MLFRHGSFSSHSGLQLPWKIDASALTDDDLAALAIVVRGKFAFSQVVGVPDGGIRFSEALRPHCVEGYPLLLVDDVLATGRSMETWRKIVEHSNGAMIGVVIFARGPVPNWVWPMFVVQEWTQCRGTGTG
jgi:hypoxanthine phosphoribosyltransferase